MKRCILIIFFVCPYIMMAQTFHYPMPPDSISDREGRIAYMVNHFWNEQSISDTANFQSPKLLLDYLYLLKQTEEKQLDNDIKHFVSLACRKKQIFGQILFWLDQILYDSSSPHYEEEVYMRFMTEVVASEADSVMKLLPKVRVKMMRQNRVGELANDFSYVDKKGKLHRLYEIDAPLLLLVFNNPDCILCHQAEEAINEDSLLQNMLNGEQLKVLAITSDADVKDWKRHKYPSNWATGFDKDATIYEKRLYDIQRLPCIYLLDKGKRVLLKEADYKRLDVYLEEHYSSL